METRVILVQCTKTKRTQQAPAKQLYDPSAYFRKMRAYAELKGDEWYILSAKYGLVHPDAVISPYNEFGLSEEQAVEIAEKIKADVVELVAGKAYCDPLTPELERHGVDVIEPFRGLQIGERLSALDTRIAGLENKSVV